MFKWLVKTLYENSISKAHARTLGAAAVPCASWTLPAATKAVGLEWFCLHTRLREADEELELASKWKARIAQAEIMYDPKASQTWTQMGVIWIEEDWQLFESKH